jgi:hypothetical protein
VLVPKIMSSNVGLNPLVIIIAIVAGSTLNGIIGALLAIPLAGALQVIAQHIWLTPSLASLPHEEVGAGGTPASAEENGNGLELPAPEVILAESVVEPEDLIGPAEVEVVTPSLPAKGRPRR